jgi:hypothetical protein
VTLEPKTPVNWSSAPTGPKDVLAQGEPHWGLSRRKIVTLRETKFHLRIQLENNKMSFENKDDGNLSKNQDESRDAAEADQNSPGTDESSQRQGDSEECPKLDPFNDLSALPQNFASQTSVRPVFTTIGVRKPNRQEFVRVREGENWKFETGCFTDEESREVYMVPQALWPELQGEVKPTCLVTCLSRNSNVPFLWPLKLPGPDGRPNRWNESAIEAASLAEQQWLRVVADMSAGCYVPQIATGNLAEPDWPAGLTLNDLIRLAFRDRLINDLQHPLLRRLRGEA